MPASTPGLAQPTSCLPPSDGTATPPRTIRFLRPDRSRLLDPRTLDQALPALHPVRRLWLQVEDMDLSEILASYKAVQRHPGRPPIDVRILITLWLSAIDQGISSARRLHQLCQRHDVYRWICGGVPVSYHSLSSFRVNHLGWLIRQFRRTVARLRDDGLVPLAHVGQDGLRIRAFAGSSSFKRAETLQQHLHKAEQRLTTLQQQDQQRQDATGGQRRTRRQAAQWRGARERCQRLRQALAELPALAAAREKRKKGDGATTRVSETDPECRKMQMADGGYRPAYNAQLGSDLQALVIVEVGVCNAGNDSGQMAPMVEWVQADYQQRPEGYYVDGGFPTNEDVEEVEGKGIRVYGPIKAEEKRKAKGENPYVARKGEGPGVAAWRARMGTEEGKAAYRQRSKSEWSNAQLRNSGLYQVTVRGLDKVLTVVLWYALAVNLKRALVLGQHGNAGAAKVAAGSLEAVALETVALDTVDGPAVAAPSQTAGPTEASGTDPPPVGEGESG